jgi:hypothetical protein
LLFMWVVAVDESWQASRPPRSATAPRVVGAASVAVPLVALNENPLP